MICLLVLTSHEGPLEAEIRDDMSGEYDSLKGAPRGLLPSGVAEKQIIDIWWDAVSKRHIFSKVYLITNANKYKYYERWATAHDFPMENVINDGTTTASMASGTLADFALALRNKRIDDDIMVATADSLFYPDTVNVWGILQYFVKKKTDLVACYHPEPAEDLTDRMLVTVDTEDQHVTFSEAVAAAAVTAAAAAEKATLLHTPRAQGPEPEPELASASTAAEEDDGTASGAVGLCPVMYCFRRETLPRVQEYLDRTPSISERTVQCFAKWLIDSANVVISGMRVPTHFKLVPRSSGLVAYSECVKEFKRRSEGTTADPSMAPRGPRAFVERTHSRVGLMGNPSDGFGGKTIALLCSNFWAEVTIRESTRLRLIPHPLNDPNEFGSLGDLCGVSKHEGYQGGLRLMQASCKMFFEYCTDHGLGIGRSNFSMQYDTNIPRQVGLAGSSAIVYSCIKALMSFFGLGYRDIPKHVLPSVVLSVENELGINAGLQDRVVQVYEGLVYMNLSTKLLKSRGFGEYENIDVELRELPQFFLVYLADPSDSGKIHNDVKMRWLNGDQQVVDAMNQFAEYTEQAKDAILARDWDRLGDLMDANFALRRETYGDKAIAPEMLKMVGIAQKHNAAAKFPGSGGAVVGMCRGDHGQRNLAALRKEYEEEGYVFCLLRPAEITREGPTRTPPRKPRPSRVDGGATPPGTAAGGALDDASMSREERLARLGVAEELELETDDGVREDDDAELSPPSLSPRSLRALQQRVAGTRGVDPNIAASSGGIW